MNQYIKTIVALIVLIALGFYANNLRQKPVETEESKKAQLAADFNFEGLTHLKIQKPDYSKPGGALTETVFSKKNEKKEWMLEKPLDALLDQSAVNEMTNKIKLAKIDSKITADQISNMADFGFGTNEIKVTLKAESSEITLCYGNKNPSGELCYVKFPEGKDIFLVESGLYNDANKSLFEFRDKKIASFIPANIKHFEISYPGAAAEEKYSFANKAGIWSMESPEKGRCDTKMISEIINKIQAASAKKIIDETDASYKNNLVSETSAEIILKLSAGATAEVMTVITVGRDNTSENLIAVKSNYKKEILMLDRDFKAELKKSAADFMPKLTNDFAVSEVNSVRLIPAGTAPVEVKKTNNDWKITRVGESTLEAVIDKAKIENLTQLIGNCMLQSIDRDTTNAELLSKFSPATMEIRLGTFSGGTDEAAFIIPRDFDKANYVKCDEPKKLYKVFPDRLNDIIKAAYGIIENKK